MKGWRWVARAVAGEPLQILHSGTPAFNPIHITDAVEATLRALNLQQSTVLNIAGVEITSIRALAELATRLAGRVPNFELIPDAAAIPYYRANLVAEIGQMQARLAFTPQIKLREGITALLRS